MKKILLSSFIAAAAAVPAFAGVNNINYQAVIKDGNSVVANKEVSLKFELLDDTDKVVYTEEQTPTTTEAGYVSCQLGQDKDITTLNWGDLSLQVSVDLGSGYQVISKGAVSSVPTALYSLSSADTDALRGEIDDFANLVEYRFDMLQNQADITDSDLENLKENLNMVSEIVRTNETAVDELNTNTDAFATMVEERFDQLQNQADLTDSDLESIKENLTMISEVVRANETAVDELNTNTDA
ncbi:MAG: hypothetical protein K2K25_08525, partial [Muribaculaceae bacterium]|nr:hypothetical protein [Muribaculaceae bacterium]